MQPSPLSGFIVSSMLLVMCHLSHGCTFSATLLKERAATGSRPSAKLISHQMVICPVPEGSAEGNGGKYKL
ncbi:hypothetical protein BJV74DRAFT_190565 [Russula compacta]|nr:hypothetical protein BJV74DRAFT_190565 [Russula compacta]